MSNHNPIVHPPAYTLCLAQPSGSIRSNKTAFATAFVAGAELAMHL